METGQDQIGVKMDNQTQPTGERQEVREGNGQEMTGRETEPLVAAISQIAAALARGRYDTPGADLPIFDGTYNATQFFQTFDRKMEDASMGEQEKLLRLPNYLARQPLELFRKLRLADRSYFQVRQILLDLFPESSEASFAKYFAMKLTGQANLETYYREKTAMGLQLGLPQEVILETLTEGLPFSDQRLVRVVPPENLGEWFRLVQRIHGLSVPTTRPREDQPPLMSGPYHSTPRRPGAWNAPLPPSNCASLNIVPYNLYHMLKTHLTNLTLKGHSLDLQTLNGFAKTMGKLSIPLTIGQISRRENFHVVNAPLPFGILSINSLHKFKLAIDFNKCTIFQLGAPLSTPSYHFNNVPNVCTYWQCQAMSQRSYHTAKSSAYDNHCVHSLKNTPLAPCPFFNKANCLFYMPSNNKATTASTCKKPAQNMSIQRDNPHTKHIGDHTSSHNYHMTKPHNELDTPIDTQQNLFPHAYYNTTPNTRYTPQFTTLLQRYTHIFTQKKFNVPCLRIPPVKIPTNSDKIITIRPYRVPICDQQEIRNQVQQMLENGIIEQSFSPSSSPVTLVTKRDKTKRFCIDYRKVNELISSDVHPLPRIEDILDRLAQANYFSTADISSAYWQVPIHPDSRPLLAFATLEGLYQPTRLPFGLKTSPQVYERAISQVLQRHGLDCVAHYFDDFIIYSNTLEEHQNHLRQFFAFCEAEKLQLNFAKCEFFKQSIDFLGYTITAGTTTPLTRNTDIIHAIKQPHNRKTLQSFLGAVNVYNKFIPEYARLRAPLNNLLKKDVVWIWDETCQKAFIDLKGNLTQHPILHLYKEGLPCQVYCDASTLDTIAGFAKYGSTKIYLHVVVDHFSRYAWTFPSKSTSIITYQQVLKRVLQDGSPKRLLTDRAPAFTSPKFRSFLLNRNIHPLLTTSNNPQANGLCERLNATLTGKLRLLHLENSKIAWTKLVKRVTIIYNKTPHSTTGFPPIYLMFGTLSPEISNHSTPYPDIDKARNIAHTRTQNKHLQDKNIYDQRHKQPHFEVGDLVLVKLYHHPNTGKLAPYFTGPHTVLEIISPNVVRIDRPNQPLQRDTDTIHVNKLKLYTETVRYISPPAVSTYHIKHGPDYTFPFKHLTPELFPADPLRFKPTNSEPFRHLDPALFATRRFAPLFPDVKNCEPDNHFNPITPIPNDNKQYEIERPTMNKKMDQKSGETISKYMIRLKEQAQRCNFGDFLQESLRDRFVAGIIDTSTQNKLLQEEKLTFDGALDIALSAESADNDLHNIKGSENAHQFSQHLHAINNTCKHCDSLINDYGSIFEYKSGPIKGIKCHLDVKADFIPKFYKFRQVPFALKQLVENEIDKLVDLNILSPIDKSDCASPLVCVAKPNGQIRLCADFKKSLNPYLEDVKYPIPNIDSVLSNFQGKKLFTKLDLSKANHQIEMDDISKKYLVVSTHKGLYKYNRLAFGIKTASEIFQKTMESFFSGINDVYIYFDDILIASEDLESHLDILKRTLNILKENNFTINKNKCLFVKNEIEYLGHKINEFGIYPLKDKLACIKNCPVPKNITELKSFLGFLSFYSKFLPNLSDLAYPLYNLLKKNVKWSWNAGTDRSFNSCKNALDETTCLSHYSLNLPLILSCDATVDSFSSWVEVSEVPSTSAYFCINFMRNCIARYGFPQVVVSDNGPPFFSSDFGDFLSKNGISHVTSPPYHPKSNGQEEVSVREVKKLLKKQLYENEQVELDLVLSRALFFIRTNVNIRKGTSPAELFLGRKIRSRLSVLSKEEVKVSKVNGQYVNSKFKVDETVKLRWITNGNPSWYTGKIIKILGRNVYLIKQGDSKKKVHQNYIKKMLPGKSHPTNMNDAERVPTPISEEKSVTTPRYPQRERRCPQRYGFWQLKVAAETQPYMTFSTPWGRYAFLRVLFGIKTAPEIFQNTISKIVEDIPGVENSIDDILIHAEDIQTLRERTKIVMTTLQEAGASLNKDKCEFEKTKIKFLGHIFTSDGIKADEEKVKAIDNIKSPSNRKELQRIFLGMVQYLHKFIPNLSEIASEEKHRMAMGQLEGQGYGKNKRLIKTSANPKKFLSSHGKLSDIFQFEGNEYIVIIDSYSGFINFEPINTINSKYTIGLLKRNFSIHGIPRVLETDNVRNYASREFNEFSNKWKLNHKTSRPHYPKSNGLAERAVQIAKNILRKCKQSGDDIQVALLNYRNTPREDMGSPAQRLLSRRTKTILPISKELLRPCIQKYVTLKLRRYRNKRKFYYDKGSRDEPTFKIGQEVYLRENRRNWKPATIVREDGPRSYTVQNNKGLYRRNQSHITTNQSQRDHESILEQESSGSACSTMEQDQETQPKGSDRMELQSETDNPAGEERKFTRSGRQ
ncbi:hypothetical protein LAZ67_11002126, partial [Cordylochernes scorpioides]